ncbi:hypothetical protein [Streptomyces sp. T028]|uniref:hypothetical protein n=1 Tax=Streptomyces sp. T028 TaxID=3394379 RepID=UPI003A83BD92
MNKVCASAAEAVADIPDGASLAVGGLDITPAGLALVETAPGVTYEEIAAKTAAPLHIDAATAAC